MKLDENKVLINEQMIPNSGAPASIAINPIKIHLIPSVLRFLSMKASTK